MATLPAEQPAFDHLFKILLIGDSGVGKSSLLTRFTADSFDDFTTPTIGVDFRLKFVTLQGVRLKLTIWDTAGQERFRTLTSSYYRGAHGVIYAFDVTRRETFESLEDIWMREVDMYSTIESAVKMVVANKVDMPQQREVTHEEGATFARKHNCLFVETSAKTNEHVSLAFEELCLKMLDKPELLQDAQGTSVLVGQRQPHSRSSCC
ncbi:hypothetical protein WJX72_002917 [[Myrmecia] bisecta]|uniref:Ras-related protein Rab-18 n=1 Tax=[Myrmecia] bisecta TaxID=41462 RepID=A0AAW1QAE7_9CHLO